MNDFEQSESIFAACLVVAQMRSTPDDNFANVLQRAETLYAAVSKRAYESGDKSGGGKRNLDSYLRSLT